MTPGPSQFELILMMLMHWILGPATEQHKHVDVQVTLDYVPCICALKHGPMFTRCVKSDTASSWEVEA